MEENKKISITGKILIILFLLIMFTGRNIISGLKWGLIVLFFLIPFCDIIINKKKTKIIPITEYFTFCKWKYKLLDDIILCIPCKDTLYRERRKLRKMIRLSLLNSEIYTTYVSFLAYLSIGNSYRYCLVLKNIYSFVKL